MQSPGEEKGRIVPTRHFKSVIRVIRLDEVPGSAAKALFTAVIDSGADKLGPARNVTAQLLDSALAYDLRGKGHTQRAIISSNKDAVNKIMTPPAFVMGERRVQAHGRHPSRFPP